jgi:hypothetical protein
MILESIDPCGENSAHTLKEGGSEELSAKRSAAAASSSSRGLEGKEPPTSKARLGGSVVGAASRRIGLPQAPRRRCKRPPQVAAREACAEEEGAPRTGGVSFRRNWPPETWRGAEEAAAMGG